MIPSLAMTVVRARKHFTITAPWLASPVRAPSFEAAYTLALRARLAA